MASPIDHHVDKRGQLFFPIRDGGFQSQQCTISINKKNVFRGIHIESFQKLVTCTRGCILDIIINMDKNDHDYLVPRYIMLHPYEQVLVKKNHGHGFLALEENSTVMYHYDGIFDQEKTRFLHFLDARIRLELPIDSSDLILSEKDSQIDCLLLGGTGFIGSMIASVLQEDGKGVIMSSLRLENLSGIEALLDRYHPRFVINSAGITGHPNISWCDSNKIPTIETNVIHQITLAIMCRKRGIHLTVIGSGAIFRGDRFYSEEEEGNYDSNFYSRCRIYLENMIKHYENVLYVRINYPIGSEPSNKNLITKLTKFAKIQKRELSVTFIDQLIPVLIRMIDKKETGVCNLVNEGSINLVDIIKMYSSYTNHKFEIEEVGDIDNNKANSLLLSGRILQYGNFPISGCLEDCIKAYVEKERNSLILSQT